MKKLRLQKKSTPGPFLLLLAIFYCNISPNTTAQVSSPNYVYGSEWLSFNNIVVVGEHTILQFEDRMHPSKRFFYLLDRTNQVCDTMVNNAIQNILPLSDSTVLIHDFNYTVTLKIKNNKLIPMEVSQFNYSFDSELGLDWRFGKYLLGRKRANKPDCYDYMAANILNQPIMIMQVKPNKWEKVYKIYTLDHKTMYMLETPRTMSSMSKEDKEKLGDINKNIKTFKYLPFKDLGEQRQKPSYYNWHSYSFCGDTLFLYDKHSAGLYSFSLQNNLKMVNKVLFPVSNYNAIKWRYIFDYHTKKHYAVERTPYRRITLNPQENAQESARPGPENKRSKRKERKKKKDKSDIFYKYKVFGIDNANQKLSFVCEMEQEPKNIADGMIYYVVTNKESSEIYRQPADSKVKLHKNIMLDDISEMDETPHQSDETKLLPTP